MKTLPLLPFLAAASVVYAGSHSCKTDDDCAWSDLCSAGSCVAGTANSVSAAGDNVALICRNGHCNAVPDLMPKKDGKFPCKTNIGCVPPQILTSSYQFIEGWTIKSLGVDSFPEGEACRGHPRDCIDNSVALRSLPNVEPGQICYTLTGMRRNEPVTVYLNAKSSTETGICRGWEYMPKFHVKVEDATPAMKTYIVDSTVQSWRREPPYIFKPASEQASLCFSTEHTVRTWGCAPYIHNVVATQNDSAPCPVSSPPGRSGTLGSISAE